jgi:glutamine synthetase
VLGELAANQVIPSGVKYLNILGKNIRMLKDVLDQKTFSKVSRGSVETLTEIADHIQQLNILNKKMLEARRTANKISDPEEKAFAYCSRVFPFFEKIRFHADSLELLVDDELWTLPKYREMLFTR